MRRVGPTSEAGTAGAERPTYSHAHVPSTLTYPARLAQDQLGLDGLCDDSVALADLGVNDNGLTASVHQR